MSSSTPNIGLTLPVGSEKVSRQIINENNTKIDTYAGEVNTGLDGLRDGIAIVADGDTHAAITSGQFVYVKNHQTLSEGLYTASTNIAANAALSGSNLTADPKGGLNALSEQIGTLDSKISTINGSIDQNITSGSDLNDYKTTGIWRIGNMSALVNKATVSGVGTTGILYVIKIGSYILQDFPNNGVRATRFSFDGGSNWDSWH